MATYADRYQGGEKYQQAFYVFEELAQAPSTSSVWSLVSQAVCELHLGRTEEAQAALEQALEKEPKSAEAIVNSLVLAVISGQDASELTEYVRSLPLYLTIANHPPEPCRRSTLRTHYLPIWRRRAPCSTRPPASTSLKSRHREFHKIVRACVMNKRFHGSMDHRLMGIFSFTFIRMRDCYLSVPRQKKKSLHSRSSRTEKVIYLQHLLLHRQKPLPTASPHNRRVGFRIRFPVMRALRADMRVLVVLAVQGNVRGVFGWS